METVIQDIRHALRSFRRNPAFAAAVVATLALAIGANTAMFAVINHVLLKPLPYPAPDRLVLLIHVTENGAGPAVSEAKFNLWKEQSATVGDISAFTFAIVNLTMGEPEQIPVGRVTREFFQLFGAPVAVGRTFTADEDRGGAPRTAMISSGLWQRRFGRDERVVGQSISLNGEAHTIIGVVGDFDVEPLKPFTGVPDVWLPLQIDPGSKSQANAIMAAGRLAEAVPLQTAQAQVRPLADQFRRQFPGVLRDRDMFGVTPIQTVFANDVRSSILILGAAVAVVLLIACVNVGNLLLIRGLARARDLAIRVAIGATRGRLMRQLITEAIILSAIGGGLGLALGPAALRPLIAVNPENILRIGESAATIDLRVVAFTLMLAVGTAVLCGLVPAFRATRPDLVDELKNAGGHGGRRQSLRGRAILAAAQVALAVVLLTGAMLLIRTMVELRRVDPGFDPHNVMTARMSLAGSQYTTTAAADRLVRNGVERMASIPGVAAAAASCCLPLENDLGLRFLIGGRPTDGAMHGMAGWRIVSPSYFEVFRIPLRRGRLLTDADATGTAGVVVISESMARQFWPDSDPLQDSLIIGRGVGPAFDEPPRRIVGIVSDVRDAALDRAPRPAMYVPMAQLPDALTAMNLRFLPLAWLVRTHSDPRAIAPALATQLREATGGLPVASVRTMDEILGRSTARTNFSMLVLTIFAGTALLLAVIGIYGVITYTVKLRNREIGIRLALGAESSAVRNQVLAQGLGLVAAGVVSGLLLASALTRFLQSQLFGVSVLDLRTFVAVPLVLSAVAAVAIWVPARRASSVDPLIALRTE